MKKVVSIALLALGGLMFFGCAENAAATSKCGEVKDGDACSKCCTDNGATGNTYSGSKCTCRGGGS